ncbi:Paraquat-inducible protein B [Klebsiella pneumoniae]|uniref:Paraquat-inducible protein B n=1 Tax=Klebsiella pneumoniae TaxID=573 RepID=A0A2X3F5S0_KLEPN|nr:Paraquat-inducible protein B [Klebsiella pneumoniae]
MVEAPEAGRLASVRRSCSADWKSGRLPELSLGSMSDRVMVKLRISKRYQYLVRNNSVFWLPRVTASTSA